MNYNLICHNSCKNQAGWGFNELHKSYHGTSPSQHYKRRAWFSRFKTLAQFRTHELLPWYKKMPLFFSSYLSLIQLKGRSNSKTPNTLLHIPLSSLSALCPSHVSSLKQYPSLRFSQSDGVPASSWATVEEAGWCIAGAFFRKAAIIRSRCNRWWNSNIKEISFIRCRKDGKCCRMSWSIMLWVCMVMIRELLQTNFFQHSNQMKVPAIDHSWAAMAEGHLKFSEIMLHVSGIEMEQRRQLDIYRKSIIFSFILCKN